MASVKIGEREIVIERFRAYKAVRAGRLVARLSKHVPEFIDKLADFRREYGEKHYRRISRAMAEMRAVPDQIVGDDMPEQDRVAAQASVDRIASQYQALLDGELKDKDYIDLPDAPDQGEEIAFMFGDLFTVAEKEVLELLALIVAPNEQLREAFKDDRVDDYLQQTTNDLLFDADLTELIEIAAAAAAVVMEQFGGARGAAGKLMSLWSSLGQSTSASAASAPQGTTPPTSSMTPSPDSSTDSPEPTDGTTSESSSEPVGASSAA